VGAAWGVPKALGETFAEGLFREVHEETGLIVEPERLTGVYKHMNAGIVALVFRCRIVDGHESPTTEADEVAWLTADEVRAHMTEAFAVRLLDVLEEEDAKVHVRSHDGRRLLGWSRCDSMFRSAEHLLG
jgi:8-oxo-dGTP diphosphatase